MVLSRAFLGTALGTILSLSLAGCAVDGGPASSAITPTSQVAYANRAAAASMAPSRFASIEPAAGPGVQVASIAPTTVADDRPAVIQKGTVIWRRTPEAAELPAKPDVSEELRQLRTTVSNLQSGLQTSQQTLAQVQDAQVRQSSQTAEAMSNVAAMATQSMKSMERVALDNSNNWTTTTQQLTAVSQQVAANQQMTATQLAALRKMSEENRALAQSEVTNVAAALRMYADSQFKQAEANTNATLNTLAQATDQSVSTLRDQTDRRLSVLWQAANQNAEKLAEQKANAVAASLAALQQQTATPDQIRAISEKTVADATPEFRAIAMRTMQESQDYIRTVARTAVQDKDDPAMSTALANAARDVITKDDRVVFAIRKAVADELQGAVEGSTTTTTPESESVKLGPDHGSPIPGDTATNLDPDRLRIAQLLAPGTNRPAPDATQMASLAAAEPAAGGQQSWSAPGTSLMRARNRADWMNIRQYKVVVHEDDQTLETLLGRILKHAEPFTGPWQIRWKISDQNREILTEKFSLDAETNFEEFVSYLAQYVVNDRGVKLTFNLFDNERIIVVSD